jgi:hypothetical protein
MNCKKKKKKMNCNIIVFWAFQLYKKCYSLSRKLGEGKRWKNLPDSTFSLITKNEDYPVCSIAETRDKTFHD